MKLNTVVDKKMPGKRRRWGAVRIRFWAPLIMRPQEIEGSWSPTPRKERAASA
jgi:hypothetical protein